MEMIKTRKIYGLYGNDTKKDNLLKISSKESKAYNININCTRFPSTKGFQLLTGDPFDSPILPALIDVNRVLTKGYKETTQQPLVSSRQHRAQALWHKRNSYSAL